MLRQTSSRNQRSKGFKVRYALQICLLLVLFLWLLYQVKHSHDKRKAFEEKNKEVSNSEEERHEFLKFGRKDLDHGIEGTSEMQKHGNEGESIEEEQGGGGGGEESKEEEGEDEERGGGDDEIDENDQDRADEEEHGEDFIDEEENTEKEENEETENIEREQNEGKDDEENEVMDTSEDQNQARTGMSSQEAHEKQYSGDDASNAVVPTTQTIRKVDIAVLEKSHEEQVDNAENNDLEDAKTNRTEGSNVGNNITEITIVLGDDEKIDLSSINAATKEEKGAEVSSSTAEDKSHDSTEVSNNQTILYGTSLADNIEVPGSVLHNVSIALDSTQGEKATVKVTTSDQGKTSSKTTVLEQTEKYNTTVTAVESVNEVGSSITINGNYGEVQTETDSSTSLVTQVQKARLTHLETLPEAGQEGKNVRDAAA